LRFAPLLDSQVTDFKRPAPLTPSSRGCPGVSFSTFTLQLFKLTGFQTMTRTTFATMARAVIDRTNIPKTKIEQTARELQNAGLLPLGRGSIARPGDLANLLVGVSSDTVRGSPATVNRYSRLNRLVEAEHVMAGNALEAWVTKVWSGNRDEADKTLRIVQSWPEIVFYDRDHHAEHFYSEDQLIERHALFDVRRSIEIPGLVIAQIGADLGKRGCQYAAV
jgi:hypothetical protein